MAETNWDKLAAGLEEAAQAARACAAEENSEDESSETPVEKQPRDLKSAAKKARGMIRERADGDEKY